MARGRVPSHSTKATAHLIYLGDRNALSTKKGRTTPNKPSRYESSFHQGATILPRSFYFVSVRDMNGAIDPDRLYSVETDPDQAEDAKPPYDTVKMKGRVEGRFHILDCPLPSFGALCSCFPAADTLTLRNQ